MSDFKTRLINEQDELSQKIDKLGQFLSSVNIKSIDEYQTTILKIQISAMKTYHDCLIARIEKL